MADVPWWRSSVIYEIVVPSFQDSDGDGWGDLNGITQRLDYLKDLGVGALWLTPIHPSPLYDIGYDVADYRGIHPRFGTLQDFDALLAAAHERQLRVLIDFVPNHTSVDHEWFKQARQSREAPKRSWYLWSDGAPGGGPPNNWINRFGHSAWTLDEPTGQYYFGSFTAKQPDLNWRNGEVRQALWDALRFWFDRGVDGVRVDALAHLIKDRTLRNNPRNLGYSEDEEPYNRLSHVFQQNQPELLEIIQEMRTVIDEYDGRMMIGEVYQSPEQLTAYQRAGAHLLLNTAMLQTDFETTALRNAIDLLEARTAVGAWPCRTSGNHDLPRLASRVGEANLRLAALLHFTVRGTPTMYYGEELGLEEMQVPPDKLRDPSGRHDQRYGRDGRRAPMPWDDGPGAGFSTVQPWLPSDEQTQRRHVAGQNQDPASLLNFYHGLLHLRAATPALVTGDYRPLNVNEPLLAFLRRHAADRLLIAANLSDDGQELELAASGCAATCGEVIFSTVDSAPAGMQSRVTLQPRQGLIIRLQNQHHE